MENEGAVIEAKRSPLFSLCSFSDVVQCEVWNITKSELKDLEAKNVYLMRKLVGCDVRNEDERLSGSRLLEMLGLESIEMMIRKKRLQWIAHCARRGRAISL